MNKMEKEVTKNTIQAYGKMINGLVDEIVELKKELNNSRGGRETISQWIKLNMMK